METLLADEEEIRALLRSKLVAGKYDYKGRIDELSDLTEALKAALSHQLAAIRDVVAQFVPVQAQVNTRLSVALEEAATYRAAEKGLSQDLAQRMDSFQEVCKRELAEVADEYQRKVIET
jgi:hypothetical protein